MCVRECRFDLSVRDDTLLGGGGGGIRVDGSM